VRVAALYDIHGMLDALDAVLADVERADVHAIVLGGDVVGGPQPAEVLARLREVERDLVWIRGNGEAELDRPPPEVREIAQWTAARLRPEEREFLVATPPRVLLELEGLGRVLFCHATPDSDRPLVTADTPEAHLRKHLDGVEADIVVSGHTHMQFDRTVDGIRWVNAGSVGMAYEGEVAAFWALLGPDVSFRMTPFDVEAAIEAVLASGWPDAHGFVDENLRAAVARADAIEFFERRAVELGQRD
jgi:putative phosphoesterase